MSIPEKDYGIFGKAAPRFSLLQKYCSKTSILAQSTHIEFNYNTSNIRRIDIDKNNEYDITAFAVKEKEAFELENFYGNFQDKNSIIVQLSKSIRDMTYSIAYLTATCTPTSQMYFKNRTYHTSEC